MRQEIEREPDDQLLGDQLLGEVELPKKVLLVPYVPGVSDRLHTIANRYQVPSWYSYSGKLGDSFSGNYKDRQHVSKTRNSVYEVVCSCGVRYIGQSYRNLKVRIAEHRNLAHSESSLSSHLRNGPGHQLLHNRTLPLVKEKQNFRRKLLESLMILHTPHKICNAGPSLEVSDMWYACQPRLRAALAGDV